MDRTGAPSAPTNRLSQEDEALRRVRPSAPTMSDADRAAHAAAQHLSPRGVAVLNRLVTALGVS